MKTLEPMSSSVVDTITGMAQFYHVAAVIPLGCAAAEGSNLPRAIGRIGSERRAVAHYWVAGAADCNSAGADT
jgi:hypothetical protein